MMDKNIRFNSGSRFSEECGCGADVFRITEWQGEAIAKVVCAACGAPFKTYKLPVVGVQ